MQEHGPWALIGGGNMGRAILAGVLAEWPSTRVIVAEPETAARRLCGQIVNPDDVVADAARAVERLDEAAGRVDGAGRLGEAGTIVLAVKPQMLRSVADAIRPLVQDRPRVVVSILAGTPGTKVRESLGHDIRVVRAMPNLAAKVGMSCTAICLSAGAHAGDEDFAVELFRSIGGKRGGGGGVVKIAESMMDAFTAVAGSGPAYLFYLAEAMERGAMGVGFSPEQARAIVEATIRGATAMLEGGGVDPAALRAAVTSKGGTTAAATQVLDQAGAIAAFERAIAAATARGAELAKM